MEGNIGESSNCDTEVCIAHHKTPKASRLAVLAILPNEQIEHIRHNRRPIGVAEWLRTSVDDQLVADYLRDHLGDLDRFAAAIATAVQ